MWRLGDHNFFWVTLMTATVSASLTMFCLSVGVAPWLMILGWSTFVKIQGIGAPSELEAERTPAASLEPAAA